MPASDRSSSFSEEDRYKKLDVIAAVLVVVGALNWGLVRAMNLNLVAAVFDATIISSVVYALVGLAGVYQAIQWKAIQHRWQPTRA